MEKKVDRRTKYDREKVRHWHIKMNLETEADLIAQVERQPSMQGYLKRLIREDIKRGEAEQ
jgi:hypothetical protein